MGLLGNVAEVESLRSQLMQEKYVVVFSRLLRSKSDGIEVCIIFFFWIFTFIANDFFFFFYFNFISLKLLQIDTWDKYFGFYYFFSKILIKLKVSYNAAGILAHMVSDGVEAWSIENPSRNEILSLMVKAINSWNLDSERNINYRSFLPLLRLLDVYHTPQCQHWAVWALANLTRVYRK